MSERLATGPRATAVPTTPLRSSGPSTKTRSSSCPKAVIAHAHACSCGQHQADRLGASICRCWSPPAKAFAEARTCRVLVRTADSADAETVLAFLGMHSTSDAPDDKRCTGVAADDRCFGRWRSTRARCTGHMSWSPATAAATGTTSAPPCGLAAPRPSPITATCWSTARKDRCVSISSARSTRPATLPPSSAVRGRSRCSAPSTRAISRCWPCGIAITSVCSDTAETPRPCPARRCMCRADAEFPAGQRRRRTRPRSARARSATPTAAPTRASGTC
jgi:hypothetical protein